VTSLVAAFEAAIGQKSMHMIKSWLKIWKKKKKMWTLINLYINLHQKWIEIEFTACQKERWHHLPSVTHIAALRVRGRPIYGY